MKMELLIKTKRVGIWENIESYHYLCITEPEQVAAYKKNIKYLFLKKIARNIKNHRT